MEFLKDWDGPAVPRDLSGDAGTVEFLDHGNDLHEEDGGDREDEEGVCEQGAAEFAGVGVVDYHDGDYRI